jgi:hypothetical protein
MLDYEKLVYEQKSICKKYNAPFEDTKLDIKIGVSENIIKKQAIEPINGLRHPSEGNSSGWYIWSGEYSEEKDFFKPLHAKHLFEYCPNILKYLGLAPGWRFLVAERGSYEDVWEDKNLLKIS